MKKRSVFISFCLIFALTAITVVLSATDAHAVPSFARQTNLPCSGCHTAFLELNSAGRDFKLNGYTTTSADTITTQNRSGRTDFKLLKTFPLSAMLQFSYTRLKTAQPYTQNNTVSFPQQFSLFLAGEIAPHVGAFTQITYDAQGAAFGLDNTDIRFSNHKTANGKDFVYGLSLNNNPTVEDLWNSTPAWGFPYISSPVEPGPAASTLIQGALAQKVIGLGPYFSYNNALYGAAALYRSAPQGGHIPADSTASATIKGAAPYWRLAVQHQWGLRYLEVGTYGLACHLYPTGITGPTDRYTDLGLDLQYEQRLGRGTVAVHSNFIHEKQTLDATHAAGGSQNPGNTLKTFKVDGDYIYNQVCAFSVGYFSVAGSADTTLYSPKAFSGSRTGSPNSSGLVTEVDFLPWKNTKLVIQYTFYNKFNGARTDYDGAGRDAKANNTLYLAGWFAF